MIKCLICGWGTGGATVEVKHSLATAMLCQECASEIRRMNYDLNEFASEVGACDVCEKEGLPEGLVIDTCKRKAVGLLCFECWDTMMGYEGDLQKLADYYTETRQ